MKPNTLLPLIINLLLITTIAVSSPLDDLTTAMKGLIEERQLRGLQLQVVSDGDVVFNGNFGQKNEAN